MGQRRGPRGASSVLGKGFVDRYTMSNIAKMDQGGAKAAKWGTNASRRVPKGVKRALGGSQCSQ